MTDNLKKVLMPKTEPNLLQGLCVRYFTPYRAIVALGLITAITLCLSFPANMLEPDDWAYYYAIQNFSDGKLVVNDEIYNAQSNTAQTQVGMALQYVKIDTDRWALEKAPGYVIYEIPFYLLGIPRWGNVFLAFMATVTSFLLLRRLRDEKTACIGSLLMLFSPVSLIMINRSYMDTFATSVFLLIGGGLYIYWLLEKERADKLAKVALLFLAFLFIAWSVVTRYTNATVALLLALHFSLLEISTFIKGNKTDKLYEIIAVVLGIGIPIAFLLLYNQVVFGSPLDYGYNYTQGDVTFAFQHLGEITPSGQSVFWNIIGTNLQISLHHLALGFPILIIALPGSCIALWSALRRHHNSWSSLSPDMRWDILLLLFGWFCGVFLLYLTYQWTANTQMSSRPFIIFARFYLPGLFPLVVFSALLLSKLRTKFALAITAIVLIASLAILIQSIQSKPVSPGEGPNKPPYGYQPTRLP